MFKIRLRNNCIATVITRCGGPIAFMFLVGFLAQDAAAQIRGSGIELNIKAAHVSVDHKEVVVGDVAEVSGSTPKIRKLVQQLDLDDLSKSDSVSISSGQVSARLLVAGFQATNFTIMGEPQIAVQFVKQQDLKRQIETKVAAELARQFGINFDDVRVRVSDKTEFRKISNAIDTTNFNVMAVFPNRLPLGEQMIRVEFVDSSGKRLAAQISLQITVLRDVVVSSVSIARGMVITADHVQSVKRPLANNNIELASLECIGCTATKDIPPYEILSTRVLSRSEQTNPIVVRRNDLVEVLLVKGSLNIRFRNAKAMTEGAVGDTIQVLNPNSNKRITAVVRDRSTVLVKR